MKQFILKALIFLKIVDEHDENISLTNVGLIVVLVKLAIVQSASIVDIGGLLLALLNYNAKKMINAPLLKNDITTQIVQKTEQIISKEG